MKRLLTVLVLLLSGYFSSAQKKQPIRVESGVGLDLTNLSKGWDALDNVAGEGKWFYKISHDESNLYVAVLIADDMLQNYASRDGVSLQFLPEAKKEKVRTFVYPYVDREVKRAVQQADFDPEKDYKSDFIARTRGYYVSGFPRIVDGLLSFQNSYGIQAQAKMENKQFYYVACISKALIPIVSDGFTVKLVINDNFSALLTAANKKGGASAGVVQGVQVEKQEKKSKIKTTTALLLACVLAN